MSYNIYPRDLRRDRLPFWSMLTLGAGLMLTFDGISEVLANLFPNPGLTIFDMVSSSLALQLIGGCLLLVIALIGLVFATFDRDTRPFNLRLVREALDALKPMICIAAPDETLQEVAKAVRRRLEDLLIGCAPDSDAPTPYCILGHDRFTALPQDVEPTQAPLAKLVLLIAADATDSGKVVAIKYELVHRRGHTTVLANHDCPHRIGNCLGMSAKQIARQIVDEILQYVRISIRVEPGNQMQSMAGYNVAD